MENDDKFFYGLILFLYVYMFLVANFTTGWLRGVLGFSGVGIFFLAIIVQEIWMRERVAPYLYLEATVVPWGRKLYLYARKIDTGPIIGMPGHYGTRLELRFDVKLPNVGKTKIIQINHELPLEERISPHPGKAYYQGFRVKHSQVDSCVLYVPTLGSADVDHASAVPVFRMRWASKDYYREMKTPGVVIQDPNNPARLVKVGVTDVPYLNTAQLAQGEKVNMQLAQQLQETRVQLTDMTHLATVKSAEAANWHQRTIFLEEVIKSLQNELVGVLKGKVNFAKAVSEYLLAFWREKRTLENATKSLRGPGAWDLGKHLPELIGFAVFVILIAFVWSQPGLLASFANWMSKTTNLMAVVVIAVALAVGMYYWRKRSQ